MTLSFQFETVPKRSSTSYQMSKKFALSEEKPRQTRPSILALAMRAGATAQAALVMEGSEAIAITRAVAEVTEDMKTKVDTLGVVAVLAVMEVTLAAITLGEATRRGSRNTMLETTKPHGDLHSPVTLVRRTRSRRASPPYPKASLCPQRHQRNRLLKRSISLALVMMIHSVAGLESLPRSLPSLPLPLKVHFPRDCRSGPGSHALCR